MANINKRNRLMRDYASRFPLDVFEPSKQYIYFLSLAKHPGGQEIIEAASPYFNTSLEQELVGGNQSIDDAFDFLDTVIESEYNKERNFLEYLQNQTKTLQEFKVPTLGEDWSIFVRNVQDALGAGEQGIQSMQNELLRLKKQNERRGTKQNISGAYEQDQITKLTEYANMLNKFIAFDGNQSHDAKKLSSEIYGLILSRYGANLIQVQNGYPIFNRTQLLSLMNTISSVILHDYIIKTSVTDSKEYKSFNSAYSAFDIKKLEQIINSDEMDARISSLIKESSVLPWLSDDMAENLGFVKILSDETFNKKQYMDLSNTLTRTNNCYEKLDKIGELFQNLYSGYSVPDSAFKITSNGNIYSEAASAINGLIHGAKGIFGTGASGAKPDSVWAYINIDVDQLLALKTSDQKKYKAALIELQSIHTEIKKLSHEMKATNTLKYYEGQEQKWNEAITNIHNHLQELYKKYQLLGNCYIIEDSTKNYISLYGKTINNKLSNSMHGGSLGPHITDQVNKLYKLAEIGGISFPNVTWLISAIINSGPDMIAKNKKNMLEDYLAAFATILLFDDQLGIVKDAYKKALKAPSADVTKIHLFSVNDGYYPLSFILRMTREALQKNYEEAYAFIKNSPSGGAQVEINGYVTEPKEAFKNKKAENQWYTTRSTALDETKLHITFLVGFLDVLQKLFPDIK